jgi:hypothetical protein
MAGKPVSDAELFEACWEILVESSPAAVQKSKRVILGALHNGSLPSWAQCLIAGDLQRYWFNTKTQDRAVKFEVKARGLQMEIERLVKEHGVSEPEAKKEIVARLKLQSVEALNRFLQRARQARKSAKKS